MRADVPPLQPALNCPACRARDLCACGQPKQVKSASCGNCRTGAAAANGNWKGGRTRHKAGYVTVHAPGHPRAGRSPYVFEHILVAEQTLGRYFVEGESVHHLNGVRDDNRPENLELWTRPQPTGIRVSDAIDWARSIYDRYVGPGAPPTMLTISPEHSWRWRESNPRPSAPIQGFYGRSSRAVCSAPPIPRASRCQAQPLFDVPTRPRGRGGRLAS